MSGLAYDIARRGLHPGVDRQYPEGGKQRTDRHHQRRKEMQLRADTFLAEQHDAKKPRLQEKGGQHLIPHQRPDDRPGPIGKDRPVGAELIGHDNARYDAHGEPDGENHLPVVEKFEIPGIFLPQPHPFQYGQIAGKADGKRRKDDMK